MRFLCAIILAVIFAGCSQHTHSDATATVKSSLGEAQALAIARQAVTTNDTWVDRATFEAQRDGRGWSVHVWRLPKTPGGDRIVLIDETGRVTAYYRGQ